MNKGMFEARLQTFTETSDRAATPQRVAALRRHLKNSGVDGMIIPHADRHQNEYLPASEERLSWLTGFTGSAGRAIVLGDRAVLFVDGRYTLQARNQVDASIFEVVLVSEMTVDAWIEANLSRGAKLGYDPWLHTAADIEKLSQATETAGAALTPLESDPFPSIWSDRPAALSAPVVLQDIRHAGEDSASKLARIQAELVKARADALVVSNTTSIAWAFNIRGGDVTHTPLALAFAIVPAEGRATLFVDGRKLSNSVRAALAEIADISEPSQLERELTRLGRDGKTVRLDASSAAQAFDNIIKQAGGKVTRGADPITALKAAKNEVEIAGMREAHHRDAVAMARFLCWVDKEAPSGKISEIDCVCALESFRRDTGLLKDVAFLTISGSGPNGAIVHYRVTEATNRTLQSGELFLVDSGAQYLDGTTDITRTISIGTPSAEMRDRFTRVLKGHIAIARAVFPEGVGGGQLDALARQYLWSAGLDYDHGTGHGVGSYLSVHEGPASIHKSNLTALKRGMILSNEPGYYKTGAYGIRIENLVLVVDGPQVPGADKPLLAFETLTLAPIDRRLIDISLMSGDEVEWLNVYHARVRSEIGPALDAEVAAWLEAATEPLSRN
jgi:Xaa-Pro aminopeptidase